MTATQQPVWELVTNLGDVDYITYGGTLVYRDTTGVYDAESEMIVPNENGWTVYRYILERCSYIDGVLSDNRFHPDHEAWFADRLKEVAAFVGMPLNTLRRGLCSTDITERAMAYDALVQFYGPHEFDSYPLTFNTLEEIEARYPE
jgi:hypothetical protein